MFGWEFPPQHQGGLGTACYGLAKSLSEKGVKITFVLPRPNETQHSFVNIISPNIKINDVDSLLVAYLTSEEYKEILKNNSQPNLYGRTLFTEVERFAHCAGEYAKVPHEVIHAHDWMTFKAGIKAKKKSKKPLVVHVHATEFDRTGGHNINQHVYNIEKYGMEQADKVIAVSNYTKDMIIKHYGINPKKITVVHNGVIDEEEHIEQQIQKPFDNIVLFLGRITLQKGPDYFIEAAKKVLDFIPNTKFIIAGSGDMERTIIERAAELGISENILFTGFLRGKDIERAYKMADVYVMPSVSEPFGITALEAIKNNVPVIISKQSGVSEVINHCLKVDFWDINELTNNIVSVLKYKELKKTLEINSMKEVTDINWDKAAEKIQIVYNELTQRREKW